MWQHNPNDSHASVLPPHTSTEKRAKNTGVRSELSSNQWWPEPPNIDYRRSNGHKHRRTKRAGGRHATHAGHSKTCANTYPDPVPVHRCRCRCSPGVHITNYAIVAHISMSKMPLSSARHPYILSHVATQPKRQPRVSPTAAHVH